MRIAVTYENGQIFQHFGHTEMIKLYTVEAGQVVSSVVLPTGESGHAAMAGLLAQARADVLICGGIGGGARAALAEAGIAVYPGVVGMADRAVELFIAGSLRYDPNTLCDHHHGGEDSCGGHGCGGCGHHRDGGCSHGGCGGV